MCVHCTRCPLRKERPGLRSSMAAAHFTALKSLVPRSLDRGEVTTSQCRGECSIVARDHAWGSDMTSAASEKSAGLTGERLRILLEQLTGQSLPLTDQPGVLQQVAESISAGQSLGYSQFNELLLNVGYDRVDHEFFLYLCDPRAVRNSGNGTPEISSPDGLREGIDAFRELALLLYGNVKYGFKVLSKDASRFRHFISQFRRERSDLEFRSRHEPLVRLRRIDPKDTHLLGYISGGEIKKKLEADPQNADFQAEKARLDDVIEDGRWNHNVYLTFDHLDVYVATSMREKHEFVFVSEFMSRLETEPHIRDLKLRIFDPTAAYCPDRLDKGLAEALMLKRASCTVYLAQESDTLGKDSELASTLAQGKPVIAFVPEMSDKFWKYLQDTFSNIYPEESKEAMFLRLLKIYNPAAAWSDNELGLHISGQTTMDLTALASKAREAVRLHYDKRAFTLKESHPLALQTNLSSGVANGVLVVRKIDACAQLIKQILLNKMQFNVEDKDGYVLLREVISGSIFRVMTADKLLTNSFWNFYNR